MSPAATISPAQARQAILRTADHLFYSRGVASVTMAEIRDEANVSMRRLYALYPSKADLVTGWLKQRHTEWMSNLRRDIDAQLSDGTSSVDALFGAIETWMVGSGFRGCGFINTHAEGSELTDQHRQVIRDHKAELSHYLDGLIPGVPGLAVLVDGAIVQAAIFDDPSPIRLGLQAAKALLDKNS